jgi:acetoin utilization deacetylase AcuC-like enzyme
LPFAFAPPAQDHLLYLRLEQLGLAGRGNTFTPLHAPADTLALCHDASYVDAFFIGTLDAKAMRRIGLPWSPALVRRTTIGTGSAILAARLAMQFGVACMTNGGTHHAHAGHGSGWCIFNDLAVAARAAQRDAGVERVLFIDLDVHHGDGTAAIFADDPSVFTFSLHCDAQPFPAVRPPSDLDVGLPAGAGDAECLAAVRFHVPALLDTFAPQLVCYNAGVDAHADDALGLLSMSDAGIAARDVEVLTACASRGVAVCAAIGGGYAPDHAAIVERHVSLHRAAAQARACVLACEAAAAHGAALTALLLVAR